MFLDITRCTDCYQILDEKSNFYYEGGPNKALSELEAMFDERVTLIEGNTLFYYYILFI